MKKRNLGRTGLTVSEIGLGCSQLGNPAISEKQAEAVILAAMESGITFFDTAARYFESESRLGRILPAGNHDIVVASKCGGYRVEEGGSWTEGVDYTRNGILATIDRSRSRLKRDRIDVMQFHGSPEAKGFDPREACDALLEARQRGWIGHLGLSADGEEAVSVAGRWPLETQEFSYNILYQAAAADILPQALVKGIGCIIKQPIANAVYLLAERPDNEYSGKPWDRAQRFSLEPFADGMPLIELALRFTLAHPAVSTSIIGSVNPEHVSGNASISDGDPLPESQVEKIRAAWRARFAE